jgi:predicted PurR-regulated permease PerM
VKARDHARASHTRVAPPSYRQSREAALAVRACGAGVDGLVTGYSGAMNRELMSGELDARALYRAVLLGAGLLVVGLLFPRLVTLLIAIFATVLLAIPLAMAADRLERHGVPRVLGALAALLAGFAVLTLLLFLLIPPFIDQTNEFVETVPGVVDDLSADFADLTGDEPQQVGQDVQSFFEGYTENPERFLGPLTSIGFSIVAVLGALVFMLITAFYIAVRPQPLIDGMLSLFPPARRDEVLVVMERLSESWVGWMQGVIVDMFVSGVLLYIGLTLIGLDLAIFFAVFGALLVVIPYFGSVIGGIPPVLFALTDSPEKALLALGVYVAVQQIEGNLIIPLVMAQRVKLHPALIAIGVVVVGQLFGIIGLFVAVPIISAAVILTDELWVKPNERHRGIRTASAVEEVTPAAVAEREDVLPADDRPTDPEPRLPVQ